MKILYHTHILRLSLIVLRIIHGAVCRELAYLRQVCVLRTALNDTFVEVLHLSARIVKTFSLKYKIIRSFFV